jgi:hypothetical protein
VFLLFEYFAVPRRSPFFATSSAAFRALLAFSIYWLAARGGSRVLERSSIAERRVPAASVKFVSVQASSVARCLLTAIVNFNA